jgi:hypothetical protein
MCGEALVADDRLSHMQAAFDQAPLAGPAPDDGARATSQPAPGGGREDAGPPPVAGPGRSRRRQGRDPEPGALSADCPVQPLGTENGVFYYLSSLNELRALKARDHGNKDLLALFAPHTHYCHTTWPRMKQGKGGELVHTGWKPEEAGEQLMAAAARKGVWNAREKVRGRGTWLDEDGQLVLHCGDWLWWDNDWRRPGVYDDLVYPTAPPGPRPADVTQTTAPGEEVLALLNSWSWTRPDIDALLLLGWIGAARLGGALKWRPLVWITGDKATGKSTLQELIRGLFGGGLLSTTDTTEAAIRQLLGQQTYPVAIDELEAEEDNRRTQSLIKLARQAASGGQIFRGGQDHTGHEFTARSCFLFSSILMPPLLGQDKSRLAILDLQKLPRGSVQPKLQPRALRELGSRLYRRLLDQWHRWEQTLQTMREALIAVGHGGRSADQFGTLLAAADLLLFEGLPVAETVNEWAALLRAETLAEQSEDVSDSQRCCAYLGSSLVMLAGGGVPRTVASWIDQHQAMLRDQIAMPMPDQPAREAAAEALGKIGLRVVEHDGVRYLAVAHAHQGTARVFEASHWAARSGAAGVWSQSLRRVDGALATKNVRVGGMQMRCVLVPVSAVLGADPEDVG